VIISFLFVEYDAHSYEGSLEFTLS